jgi:dUTPase
MQLTGKESVTRGCLSVAPKKHRPASYDLNVGKIVVRGEEQKDDPVIIQPQETFVIESEQAVTVPKGLVGYAMPKTSLCNQGVLVLNTGLVDPGYSGTLSTIAINFSNTTQRVRRGEAFLRLVFHELIGDGKDEVDDVNAPKIEELRGRSRFFAGSFLDVPAQADAIIRKVTTELLDRQRNGILLLISTVGFLFVMWNLGSYFLMNRQASVLNDKVTQSGQREVGILQEKVNQLESRLSSLEARTAPKPASPHK